VIKKMTPVLAVEQVEPCVRFWTERLGFQKTGEVPEGDTIGFAMLQKGNIELMYQSYASIRKDLGGQAPDLERDMRKGPTFLYVEVEDLAQVAAAMQGATLALPERLTFYGAKEVGFRDPGGHVVVFAQMMGHA